MVNRPDRVALYTTFYPGAERYIHPWYRSVMAQTDRQFDLWISLDALSAGTAQKAADTEIAATWLHGGRGASPAAIRQAALGLLTERYDLIVLVDADDILEPTRIEAAREYLRDHEIAGCALRLIDQYGCDLQRIFSPAPASRPEALLPTRNVFGLSNSAYRAESLRRCLPIPEHCVLIDWLLATRAWSLNGDFGFDYIPRMHYRQHAANIAGVLGPFSEAQVLTAARRVLDHYRCVLTNCWGMSRDRKQQLEAARDRAGQFYRAMVLSPTRLHEYVSALNKLTPEYVWWWQVAHSQLENIWKN